MPTSAIQVAYDTFMTKIANLAVLQTDIEGAPYVPCVPWPTCCAWCYLLTLPCCRALPANLLLAAKPRMRALPPVLVS